MYFIEITRIYFFVADRVIYARKAGEESIHCAELGGDKIDMATASVSIPLKLKTHLYYETKFVQCRS